MSNPLMMSLAARLCSADMSCGFISVAPVMGNREELIQQRLIWYHQWLLRVSNHWQKERQIPEDTFSHLLMQAVELTAADILSDAIALAPVLYDRDSRIMESVTTYFTWFQTYAMPSTENNELMVEDNYSPE